MSNESAPKAEVITLKDHVEYSASSVVSKVLIKQKSGSLTLFAFDKGQELSEHTAPFNAVVEVLDGEAEIIIGGKSHVVRKGQSIIMPADISHALKATLRFKMLLNMLRTVE
jgi:quercetin dioxygenase-like cupin family protein